MTGNRENSRAPLAALVVCAILVLVASVVIVVPEKTLTKASLASATSTSTRAVRACQGPIDARQAGESAGDADFAGGAPASTVSMSAIALDPTSNALYGVEQSSQTSFEPGPSDAGGKDAAPRIARLDAEGNATEVDPATSALLDAVYSLETLENSSVVTASTADGAEPVVDATQAHVTGSGDYRGFALSRCARATTVASFAGLTTRAGTSDALILINPGSRASRARVTAFSENGVEPATQGSDIVVGPGETIRVPLATLVDERETVALDVEVHGTALAMSAELVRRDGLVPMGTEHVQPSAPESTLVFPGVAVRDGGSAHLALARTARGGAPGDPASVRAEDSIATARAFDSKGAVMKEWEVKDPGQGASIDTALEGLDSGTYTIIVSARSSVVGTVNSRVASGARQGDTVGLPQDFATYTPVEGIDSASILALGRGAAGGTLTLESESGAQLSVAVIKRDGSIGTGAAHQLEAGHSLTLAASDLAEDPSSIAGVIVVSQDGGLYRGSWSQAIAADDGGTLVTTLPLIANAARATGMTVRVEH